MHDKDITVSSKHLVPRVIGLIAAIVIAVGAFGFGVSRIGHKDPGYYTIETEAAEEAALYAGGIHLNYRFDGSSSEIRVAMNQLKADYSTALLRAYKLTDPIETYDGYVNIAVLNASMGTPVSVSAELFDILCDAWEQTQTNPGYNMFAGLYYAAWDELLYLNDPAPFDPAVNPDTLTRLQTLWSACADLSNFTFEITDNASRTVLFDISDSFRAMMSELETGTNVLDLNRLREAYELMLVRDVLADTGYTQGYLSTDSGCSLTLPGYTDGTYLLYDLQDGAVVISGELHAPSGSGAVLMRSFALSDTESGYYKLEQDEQTIRRFPWISMNADPSALSETGSVSVTQPSASVCALLVMDETGDLAAAAAAGLNLIASGYPGSDSLQAQSFAIAATETGVTDLTIACTNGTADHQIVLMTDSPDLFTPGEGYEILLCD